MGFPVLSSFCGLSLRTGGLFIGYGQFFLSAILFNCIYDPSIKPVAFCAFFVVNVVTGFLFIFGILANEPSYMRPNIVWGKIVFVLGMILCLWFAVWDVLFVIGMITDLVPMYRVGDVIMIVHVAWLVCAIVTVLAWYLVSLMSSLYDSTNKATLQDIETHQDAHVDQSSVDDAPTDDQDTLLTFKIYKMIKTDAHILTSYIRNSFEYLEKYFDKFQESVARRLSDFVELPVEDADTPNGVRNNNCNVKTVAKPNENMVPNSINSCNIQVDTDADKETLQSERERFEKLFEDFNI